MWAAPARPRRSRGPLWRIWRAVRPMSRRHDAYGSSSGNRRNTSGGILYLWVKVECNSGDLHVVTGLEASRFEGSDHAYAPQAAFEMGHGLVVLEVIPGHQALD